MRKRFGKYFRTVDEEMTGPRRRESSVRTYRNVRIPLSPAKIFSPPAPFRFNKLSYICGIKMKEEQTAAQTVSISSLVSAASLCNDISKNKIALTWNP